MTKRAGFAIAAGTLASILLAGAASAGNVHAAPKHTITQAGPTSIKGGLINRGNLGQSILGQIGTPTGGGKPGSGGGNKGSGGTVVSCHPGSGCTTKPSADHDHDGYGRGHDHDGHGYGRYWWRWYGYGYGWRYATWYPIWPVVYTAPDYVDGCAFEYKTRIRFIPGIGFRRVQVKYCIAVI
jgi:hypothetical protein